MNVVVTSYKSVLKNPLGLTYVYCVVHKLRHLFILDEFNFQGRILIAGHC